MWSTFNSFPIQQNIVFFLVGNLRPQPEIPMPGQMTSFPSYPSSNTSRVPGYRPQQPQQQPHHQQQQQQQQQFPLNSQRATSVANSHHSHMGPSRSFQQVSLVSTNRLSYLRLFVGNLSNFALAIN